LFIGFVSYVIFGVKILLIIVFLEISLQLLREKILFLKLKVFLILLYASYEVNVIMLDGQMSKGYILVLADNSKKCVNI
jgi:hypothetical protein